MKSRQVIFQVVERLNEIVCDLQNISRKNEWFEGNFEWLKWGDVKRA